MARVKGTKALSAYKMAKRISEQKGKPVLWRNAIAPAYFVSDWNLAWV